MTIAYSVSQENHIKNLTNKTMLQNFNHWKTTVIGIIIALLSILQISNIISPEQMTQLSAAVPLLGDKLQELLGIIAGIFLFFARDPKDPKAA